MNTSEQIIEHEVRLAEDVIQCALLAYKQQAYILGYDPKTIPHRRRCAEVSHMVAAEMRNLGYGARREPHRTIEGEHSVVRIDQPDGTVIIADGTWKQFFLQTPLPDDAPDVLIGAREMVTARLLTYGLDPKWLPLWSAETVQPLPWGSAA